MPAWLDAHTHLDSDDLYPEREELLNRAHQADVARLLLVNSEATESSFERTISCLRMKHSVERYACFGIHPHQASLFDASMENRLLQLLEADRVVALGEFGLDFYYNYSPQDIQITVFQRQLILAKEKNIPVVIHCRDAYSKLAEILAAESKYWNGMIHCFTGTPDEMIPLIDLGFHISFSGIVTFKKATLLQEAAKRVPLERILIETDAPFLAPVPHRGKRNEPSYVVETGKFIAALRHISEDELKSQVWENFDKLFLDRISEST